MILFSWSWTSGVPLCNSSSDNRTLLGGHLVVHPGTPWMLESPSESHRRWALTRRMVGALLTPRLMSRHLLPPSCNTFPRITTFLHTFWSPSDACGAFSRQTSRYRESMPCPSSFRMRCVRQLPPRTWKSCVCLRGRALAQEAYTLPCRLGRVGFVLRRDSSREPHICRSHDITR